MVILSAIGRFFKKIWDWIKQTAWIQPLLIVGLIFGVIFSIPAIVNAIKNGKTAQNTYAAYYNRFQLSLDGKEDSEADTFTKNLTKVMQHDKTAEKTLTSKYGNKFFVAYVSKSCTQCEEAKGGFEIFQERFNKDAYKKYWSLVDRKEEFKMITIFTDEETEETTSKVTAFSKYLDRNQEFFALASDAVQDVPYNTNGHISASALESFETADETDFYSPTILLVELGSKADAKKAREPGVTELMFGLDGSDKFAKAETLIDCWNHTGNFSDDVKK